MQFNILSHTKETVDGQEVRQVLTIQVTYDDNSTSEHGFVLTEEDKQVDINEVATKYAASLAGVLTERKPVVVEELHIEAVDKTIDAKDVQAILDAAVLEKSDEPSGGLLK
jgi:hypothetical protein